MTIPELGTIRADAPARDRAHVQPHARPARRGQAPLPVPVDRLPRRASASWTSCAGGSRGVGGLARAGRGRGRRDARQRHPEAAGHRRGDRLAARAGAAGGDELDGTTIERTLGSVLKYGEDQEVSAPRGSGAWCDRASSSTRAGRRVRPPPARGGRAGHAGALGAVRRRACADPAGGADAPVLDGARRARVRPGAGEDVRPRVLRGLRRRVVDPEAPPRTTRPGALAAADDRPATRGPRAARPAAPRGAGSSRRGRRATTCRQPVHGSRRGAPARQALRRARDRPSSPLLYRLMSELEVAAPLRRTRRPSATGAASTSTCGARCAARCARAATRSGSRAGPARASRGGSCCCATSAARWSRTPVPTCSSSTCAGRDAEAFVFATRLTRITRALPRAPRSARSSAPPRPRRTGHPARDRRGAEDLQRPPRPPRHGPRRGDRDPQRRLGARRPGAGRRARWSASRGSRTGSCG